MLVDIDFKIPAPLSNAQFHFEMLNKELTEIDYEAVMSSKERLRQVFFEHDTWPEENMTIEFNTVELIQHEHEFSAREAFAYAVFSPNKDNYIGCVYVYPTKATDYDREVYLWVKDNDIHLDNALYDSVEQWLKAQWPFQQRAYPGRTMPWHEWNKKQA